MLRGIKSTLCEGKFEIPIKIYRPSIHPLFPNGGEFSPWLERLEVNEIDKYFEDW